MSDKKEKEELLISTGSPYYPTVYKLSPYKGKKYFDIRKYFRVKGTGKLSPTRKGISLNKLSFEALIKVINNHEKSILEWLDSKEDAPSEELIKKLQKQSKKVQDEIFSAKEYDYKKSKWSDSSFFKIKYDGDKRTVVVNENHKLSNYLNFNNKGKKLDLNNIINLIMLSFQHTVDIYDDDQEFKVSDFVEDFRYNWGIILKNYIKKHE